MGTVIVSLDCEGLWGLADNAANWRQQINAESLSWAYGEVLSSLARYGVPSTFAFVGLFASDPDEVLEQREALSATPARRAWVSQALEAYQRNDTGGWLVPEGVLSRIDLDKHELASHTYTHLPLGGAEATDSDAEFEINSALSWGSAHGFDIRTFVFPRNQIPSTQVLGKSNVAGYRAAPAISGRGSRSRLLRLTSELRPRATSSPTPSPDLLPVSIPGDTFLNWRHGPRALIPPRLTIMRWRSILQHAAETDGVAHLWLHPHNLITGRNQIELWNAALKEIARLAVSNDITAMTQREFVESQRPNPSTR